MKKYTYKEIEQELKRQEADGVDFGPFTADTLLSIIREVMVERNISPDDRVWDWPQHEQELNDAYDRAMSIL